MAKGVSPDDLRTRKALPDALRVLLAEYPRDSWHSHAHFDGLTRFWLERHLLFRTVQEKLQAETRAYLAGLSAPQAFAAQSARMGGFLIQQLHGHHQIEDHHYFPILSRAEPRLEKGFALLDADHHALHGHLDALAQAFDATLKALSRGTNGRVQARNQAGRLEQRLTAFAGFLDRHLTDEEELVVPVILHNALRL
ncbi:MAG: hemerythrin domain-containing protein [Pararhodobacter sp.]|nr:hemerythrin domain-containing protein [Pararhodobacter sp.]